ncbi:unnamed protein product [Euphydryas editha]|uniref:Uncharacterized protein n=1 Tax=Euphydryas editha TaxID=104508 RepID=A0AAU9UYT6_EUPED|nr:unnamed protein product [Euphydryas editha]
MKLEETGIMPNKHPWTMTCTFKVKLASTDSAYRRLQKLQDKMRGKQQRPLSAVTKDAHTSPITAASYVKIIAETRLMDVDTRSDGESTDRPSVRRNSKECESVEMTNQLSKRKKEEIYWYLCDTNCK